MFLCKSVFLRRGFGMRSVSDVGCSEHERRRENDDG